MRILDIPEFIQDRETYSMPSTAPIEEVLALMKEKHIGAIPVIDDGVIVGIFSERDIVHRIYATQCDLMTTTLAEVMTKEVQTVFADSRIEEAIDKMVLGKFRHMPVVDKQGKLLAFLSQRDFMAFCWMKLESIKSLTAH